ncbi:alpha-(1,3)-fucosyltransferase 10-like isoform X1 [Hydractinia symbiolongicarpus]|uniref:alpha-(1,3)-fucosyltransferase 10-like isoform X1 n=1 Tax=Hydractinia symbiolongicarpus TaxID=13093 RepID=UPI002550073F|nr:alpha-(1,3)-fucosyltransferase 10-like isoform X1 [Hydractinia symbiolongicarpus]
MKLRSPSSKHKMACVSYVYISNCRLKVKHLYMLFLLIVLFSVALLSIIAHYNSLKYVWEEIDLLHKLDPDEGVIQERFQERWGYFMSEEEREQWKINDQSELRMKELDDGSYHDFEVDRVAAPVINSIQHAEKEELPFLLWWTPFTGDQAKIKQCWEGKCLFSQNQSLYDHPLTKAFFFYGTDFHEDKVPLPRKAHHEWALLHEESPKNQPLFFYEDTLGLFNHTSTFKQQSSYPISTQYVKSEKYILNPLKYSVHEKDEFKLKHGLAPVVFIQSGCNPPSDRDSYVQELMKHIKIDSYGKCLHNKDLPKEYQSATTMHNKGFIEFLQKYKFMISFENAICDDYMTEKIFRTLNVGAVPIYKGAPNIQEWLPNSHSAIVVDDFKSPKELADFILHLDTHPKEYEKYLEYKRSGITNSKLNKTLQERQWGVDTVYKMSFITGFECHVCDQIHRNKKRVAEGLKPIEHKANIEHYGCPAPKKYDLPPINGAEDWERETWLWEYNDAAKRSAILKEKVLSSLKV